MDVSSENAASLPYHEPGIVTTLVLASFLLLLNVINAALDKVLYCGLLGQVLIGIAWGTPGAKWLSVEAEGAIVQLGYLGLILLVYEGGLHTSFQSLKANLLLSSGVAFTGIVVPIALSYTLQELLDAMPVQAFAAGAALCSTSLGTTFTVLGSSGFSSSRLGVVLTSAAMMDDVVGLVMVQVISNLGGEKFNAITVVRPVLMSIAFAVVVPVACLFVVWPTTMWLNSIREAHPTAALNVLLRRTETAFALHSALLAALIAGASYAGTSNLFAAYIAGATISWWDSEVPHAVERHSAPSVPAEEQIQAASKFNEPSPGHCAGPSQGNGAARLAEAKDDNQDVQLPEAVTEVADNLYGAAIYKRYYLEAVSKILQPLFFASIEFSIPITRMFRGAIVWRGLVYAVLMAFAKLVCGIWLIRLSVEPMRCTISRLFRKVKRLAVPHLWGRHTTKPTVKRVATADITEPPVADASDANDFFLIQTPHPERRSSPDPPKPTSIHPALILALAMCARGEIGFLISGVAESNGIFSPSGVTSREPSDIFLVVTWAIVLCTIMGPLGVGFSVRRVKKLQDRKNKQQNGAGRDVLGVWGVE